MWDIIYVYNTFTGLPIVTIQIVIVLINEHDDDDDDGDDAQQQFNYFTIYNSLPNVSGYFTIIVVRVDNGQGCFNFAG